MKSSTDKKEEKEDIMSNFATRAAKKTTKKLVKGSMSYAKGMLAKGFFCWALAALVAWLPEVGINIPTAFTGTDTIAVAAFVLAGIFCFGRGVSVGRAIGLFRTFLN